jgi:hypothetical protein
MRRQARVKPGDVITYARARRKTGEDPQSYNFVGIILEILPDVWGDEHDAKVLWSDNLTTDLVPLSMILEFYEVIYETW